MLHSRSTWLPVCRVGRAISEEGRILVSILCGDAPDAPGHSTQYSCLSEVASSEYRRKYTVNHCCGWADTAGRLSKSWWKRSHGSDRCQNGSEWIRMDQNGSEWIRMDQNGSEWIRMDQNGSDCLSDNIVTCLATIIRCCLGEMRATCHTKQTPTREINASCIMHCFLILRLIRLLQHVPCHLTLWIMNITNHT